MARPDFAEYLSDYLVKYLPLQMGASTNTIKSYRDSFTVFLRYCRDELHLAPEKLTLQKLDRKMIEGYLLWLEESKGCSASTRNHRLAVLHAFLRYVSVENPEHLSRCNELLEIEPKHAPKKAVEYLSIDELQAIFSQPDTDSPGGQRDLAMLSLLYDSGARVQELIDTKFRDIRFNSPATVKLCGKGNKSRIVPLMPDTAKILTEYINFAGISDPERYLFLNSRGQKFTRSGVEFVIMKYVIMAKKEKPNLPLGKVTPHVFRHSKAMHLVQANVNLIYIRDLLGHESVKTTEIYAKADSAAKRQALEQAGKNIVPETKYTASKQEELLDWLKNLI